MFDFGHLSCEGLGGKLAKLTIASGPVIIEDGKVLLDKHGADDFWKFPGGRLTDSISMKDNAKLKAKAELGLEIDITTDPYILTLEKEDDDTKEYIILIHYQAKRLGDDITPGSHIKEWAWHDINNLPDDCGPNIKAAVEHFSKD